MIEVIVSPLPRSRFRLIIEGKDYGTSNTPLFTAARLLLAEGRHPDTVLQMRHAGSSILSMKGRIGKLAGLTVIETNARRPSLGRYKPFSRATGEPQAGKEEQEATCLADAAE